MEDHSLVCPLLLTAMFWIGWILSCVYDEFDKKKRTKDMDSKEYSYCKDCGKWHSKYDDCIDPTKVGDGKDNKGI